MATAPLPRNEPVRGYAPGDPGRETLAAAIRDVAATTVEAPMRIAGRDVTSGRQFDHVAPHDRSLRLAEVHAAEREHVDAAIAAALEAAHDWSRLPFTERAAVFLRAADLLAGSWRDLINAATVMGQSKSIQQAEIDAACELIDFLRFNVAYAEQIEGIQPDSAPGMWNRMEPRGLEGFVLAITPFNFTAIAGNLPTAPAIMGNVVVWKPSEKQALSAHHTMRLLEAAGLPPGVINLVHGDGALVSEVATEHPDFAGLHFTGSTTVFQSLWRRVGEHIGTYRSYPRLVGETGGKDFVVAHPSADPGPIGVALARGAFEYQGQKCSAASRAYIPRSLWANVRDDLVDITKAIPMGDVADMSVFMGAVIDQAAHDRCAEAIARARDEGREILVGGTCDDSTGWFVEPTVIVTDDPRSDTMERELFGPVLTVHVYDDADWRPMLDTVDSTSQYALTGAILSTDRAALAEASDVLRHAAGNLYWNDKPTGSVVGQQPFGGARGSGTNDKAGSLLNMVRWSSPRVVKETFDAPLDWRYPHMG